MDNFYGGFGVMVIGTKSYYYTMLLGYLASFGYGLYATAFASPPFLAYPTDSPLFDCIAYS